jgi:hypothetical protein
LSPVKSAVIANEPVRVRVRQRRIDHRVDDGEDGAVGADAERERGDRDAAKPATAESRATQPAILQKAVHHGACDRKRSHARYATRRFRPDSQPARTCSASGIECAKRTGRRRGWLRHVSPGDSVKLWMARALDSRPRHGGFGDMTAGS